MKTGSLLIFLLLLTADATLGSVVETAWERYHRCMQGKVKKENLEATLDSSINVFWQEFERGNSNKEAAVGQMRAALLKGDHVKMAKKEKKQFYIEGEKRAALALKKFPDDGDVIYWYIACLGRWAESVGIMKAARQGVADKVKGLCEKLIKMDSPKMQARGHRILGRTHYKAPYIPLILKWPSNKKSIEHLKKSLSYDGSNPTTLQFLAEVYYKEGEKKLALTTIKKATSLKARPEYLLADRLRIKKCRVLERKWTEK